MQIHGSSYRIIPRSKILPNLHASKFFLYKVILWRSVKMYTLVWPGHSRWLFSCSLYSPLLGQSLCLLYSTLLADPSSSLSLISKCLHTYPWSQLEIVLISRSEYLYYDSLSNGEDFSPGFPGNLWANLMSTPCITCNLPLPLRGKTAATSCLLSATHGGASLQDLASDEYPCFRSPTH